MNTLSGPLEGDFELWDGEKFYQYTKILNDLMIRDFVNDGNKFIIPNKLFDTNTKQLIKKDIEEKKLTKQIDNEQVFTKIVGKDTTKVLFDKTQEIILESSFISEGKTFHEIKIDKIEDISQFEDSLFIVDVKDAKITNMR